MSRISRRLRLAKRGEDGFTLVEVMAAMVVFALVATGVTAMFASGLRASLLTKMDTTAKNLSQQRFESIRNLPFHIDQVAAGTNPPDLLDTYYVSSSGSVGRGTQGFVPNGATRWTDDGDPATGSFYRYVQTELPGFPKFKQYVATQFLDDSGNPYNPTSFNALVTGFDTPPTMTVGVSVTTLWAAGKLNRVSRTYSQITPGRPSEPKALLQSALTALRLTGGVAAGRTVSVDLATLSADGSLSQTVSAAQALRGATLTLSGGAAVNGAVSSVKAPPNSGTVGTSASARSLVEDGLTWATVGSTRTSAVSASSSTGQVLLSSSASPARADVLGSGLGANIATFTVDDSGVEPLSLLGTHAFVADAGCGGSCSNVGVSGYSSTTKSGLSYTSGTSASATVRGTLALLPTTFAPGGLIRMTLTSATVSCRITHNAGSSPTAAADVTYAGTVSYWAPFEAGNIAGYVTVNVSSSDVATPLTNMLLASTQVGNDLNGEPLWLSDYFSSWSSMDAPAASGAKTLGADGTTAAASFGGMLGVTSVPLRAGDDSSVIGAQLGVGSCTAEDYR